MLHDFWNPLREVHNPGFARVCDEIIQDWRPDIVHIHNFPGLSFDPIRLAKRAVANVIVSLHNYFPLCSRDDLFFADTTVCSGPTRASCSRCLGTMLGDDLYVQRYRAMVGLLNECDALLAVSSRVAELYIEHGVRPELLTVERIGSTTAERLWREIGSSRSQSDVLPSTPLQVIFFGALLPRKGLMTLLQAVRLVENPNLVAVHVFGGEREANIALYAQALSIFPPANRACVEFHGPFAQTDLVEILKHMDIAVFTPRWEDSGPQTVMESLGAGLPVVCAPLGGVPDMIIDGKNGIHVNEGDAQALARVIDDLAMNPERVIQLRRGITPPRSMEDHRQALDDVYKSVKSGARRA